jgi:hypothetical protein
MEIDHMKRLAGLTLAICLLGTAAAAEQATIQVQKTATCGCCAAWVSHLRKAGFTVQAQNVSYQRLARFKRQHGIRDRYASCHTARVGGYTIEGHVPAQQIVRLLKEGPEAIGLSVPGMPVGSPGMDSGSEREAYRVMLLMKDGTARTYKQYSASR